MKILLETSFVSTPSPQPQFKSIQSITPHNPSAAFLRTSPGPCALKNPPFFAPKPSQEFFRDRLLPDPIKSQ